MSQCEIEVGDQVLIGVHGDGSPRYGRVTAITNNNGDHPEWLHRLPPQLTVTPEPYVSHEVAPGVFTLDTMPRTVTHYA